MCGIVGVVSNAPVNQLIYDALLLLQHRGQDAAGIVTQQDDKFYLSFNDGIYSFNERKYSNIKNSKQSFHLRDS